MRLQSLQRDERRILAVGLRALEKGLMRRFMLIPEFLGIKSDCRRRARWYATGESNQTMISFEGTQLFLRYLRKRRDGKKRFDCKLIVAQNVWYLRNGL